MLAAFKHQLKRHFSAWQNKRILLAVSGGLDSMVLADLCLKSNLNVAIAHCNFKLRAKESDDEEQFVVAFAELHDLTIFSKQFSTEEFSNQSKLSIQMAARHLRYDFFEKLRQQHQFDAVFTAHHADDNLETFFINLSRGTGIDGLVGIPVKNNYIIRPLLTFTRTEILAYAKENHLKWCEDSSNASVKYQRNQLRHELIPVLKTIYPSIIDALSTTQAHLDDTQNLLKNHIQDIEEHVIKSSKSDTVCYSISELKNLHPLRAYLHPLFHRYGFRDYEELLHLIDAQSGKQLHSKTHTILKDRSTLMLTKRGTDENFFTLIKEKNTTIKFNKHNLSLKLQTDAVLGKNSKEQIFLDLEKIQFPLVLRSWVHGDFFYPYGMTGKKKLSKFFKDEKLSLIEKSKVLLLCSNESIVWVLGRRPDLRFIATSKSNKILKISILNANS